MTDTPDVESSESSKNAKSKQSGTGPAAGTRVLAMANQKGGVGKTTSAINLATAMAACRQRVLLIDIDPQGNASTGLAVPRDARSKGSYQVLTGELPLAQAIQPTLVPGMDICPAGEELLGAEIELVDLGGREYRLRKAIRDMIEASGTPPYDFIIIDCPPGLGLLTLNALVAADALMVPLQTEFYALEGLSHLAENPGAGAARPEPGAEASGHRPHHGRPAQQPEPDGRGGRTRTPGRQGLQDDRTA